MRDIILDGKYMQSKDALYEHLHRELSLPPYFGNNLDALWDVLTEWNKPISIQFLNTSSALDSLEEYGKNLIDLLKKIEQVNPNFKIQFDD